jgi:hypothetical protein
LTVTSHQLRIVRELGFLLGTDLLDASTTRQLAASALVTAILLLGPSLLREASYMSQRSQGSVSSRAVARNVAFGAVTRHVSTVAALNKRVPGDLLQDTVCDLRWASYPMTTKTHPQQVEGTFSPSTGHS